MKKYLFILLLSILFNIFCSKIIISAEIFNEESAVQKIADDIYSKQEVFKDKKLAVFNFSNLEGKDTDEGKRLSKKLLEILLKKGNLKFVERSEIDKIIKAQSIEQTGIVDTNSISETGKVLPVNVMIYGTIAQLDGHGELTVKAVDMISGEIYIVSTVQFSPKEKFSYKENPDKLILHKKDPEKFETVNQTFKILNFLSVNRPLVFLLATVNKNDIPMIRKENPKLGKMLRQRRNNIQNNNPQLWNKIKRLRKGVKVLEKNDPEKYDIIKKKKIKMIKEGARKK